MLSKRISSYLFVCAWISTFFLTGCENRPTVTNVNRPLICIFSDFSDSDACSGELKGAIKSVSPQADILDLSNSPEFNRVETAGYLFDKAAHTFPAGTIFVVAVDPGTTPAPRGIVARTKAGKTYIAPDNGVLTTVLAREEIVDVRALENDRMFLTPHPSNTLRARDIYGPVAAHLANGISFDQVGEKAKDYVRAPIPEPTVLKSRISGEILYIDRYGNIITNLKAEHTTSLPKDKLLKLSLQGKIFSLPCVSSYAEAPKERLSAVINVDGELELAIPGGNASKLLGAQPGEQFILQL